MGTIVHVCHFERFIPPFIRLVDANFGDQEHLFFIQGAESGVQESQSRSHEVTFIDNILSLSSIKLLRNMQRSDKIILHGLFKFQIVLILFFMPWLLRKCYWVIWGADLYIFNGPYDEKRQLSKNTRWKIKEFFRRCVIKNIGNLISFNQGDIDLARSCYGAQGRAHNCVMYMSNTVDGLEFNYRSEDDLNIMVGNSADPSNYHVEMLKMIAESELPNCKIFVVLAYGDADYARDIISEGKSYFGDNFVAITDYMKPNDYRNFQSTVDVVMFNHRRSQAVGNIISFLALGKTVYINPSNTLSKTFLEMGFHIKELKPENSIDLLSEQQLRENANLAQQEFSSSSLVQNLERIFN